MASNSEVSCSDAFSGGKKKSSSGRGDVSRVKIIKSNSNGSNRWVVVTAVWAEAVATATVASVVVKLAWAVKDPAELVVWTTFWVDVAKVADSEAVPPPWVDSRHDKDTDSENYRIGVMRLVHIGSINYGSGGSEVSVSTGADSNGSSGVDS